MTGSRPAHPHLTVGPSISAKIRDTSLHTPGRMRCTAQGHIPTLRRWSAPRRPRVTDSLRRVPFSQGESASRYVPVPCPDPEDPGQFFGLASASRGVQRHCVADESLEGGVVNFVAFVQLDGTPGVAFKAGVEELRRIPSPVRGIRKRRNRPRWEEVWPWTCDGARRPS
jgi:hypothetical protein